MSVKFIFTFSATKNPVEPIKKYSDAISKNTTPLTIDEYMSKILEFELKGTNFIEVSLDFSTENILTRKFFDD